MRHILFSIHLSSSTVHTILDVTLAVSRPLPTGGFKHDLEFPGGTEALTEAVQTQNIFNQPANQILPLFLLTFQHRILSDCVVSVLMWISLHLHLVIS